MPKKYVKKPKPRILPSGFLKVNPEDPWFMRKLFKMMIRCAGAIDRTLRLCHIRKKDFYLALKKYPKFKSEYEKTRDYAIEIAVDECIRRAVEGILKPIFYQGKLVGAEKVYSDYLLCKLLAAYRSNWRYPKEVEVLASIPYNPVPIAVDFKESDIKSDAKDQDL